MLFKSALEKLRLQNFGDWEGMHGTPSEIAITQITHRILPPGDALYPPEKLSASYIKEHSGDRHGPPEIHRAKFPDGRVGSHSALASREAGIAIANAAVNALIKDYLELSTEH